MVLAKTAKGEKKRKSTWLPKFMNALHFGCCYSDKFIEKKEQKEENGKIERRLGKVN